MALCGRRLCAVLAVLSAVLHLTMLGHARSAVVAVLIAAMASVCLFCGYELWRAGSIRIWCLVGVMSLAMVAAHLSLPGHRHAEQPAISGPPAESMSMLMGVATTVSLAEAVIAAAVLWVVTRRRAAGLL
ncbi:hypothetical protein H7J08_11325 [Mycobacterium frederiksbergense]|uniref:Uncharacterized protein n=1 Tax=Mycolicibacterium frederiksbergense TaxID=117567 RepID=A0A6H0S6X4_9MYCO|nr:hypothetical protein [Mycolicibacterium frederiksbergense]MCV7045257.1 hypothetical protein [Mycolicibacterium frederiksbergense]QIV83014.1 hypothetical protein EXE63_20550 [Mycolicibacterium frederiksbergense]